MSDRIDPDDRRNLQSMAVLGLGFSIVVTLIVFIVGGILLDRWLDTSPILTLSGVAVGLIAAGYELYELTLVNRKDRPAGPMGRALGSRMDRRTPPRSGG